MPAFDWQDAFRSTTHSAGWTKGEGGDEPSFLSLFAPVDPFNRWKLIAPVVSMVGAAAVVMLTGVAAISLAVMTAALLAVVFLLTQVFGYEIVLPNMPNMAR